MAGRPWSEDDKAHMRHYGITFTGSIWNLWYIAPNTFETWTGCSMSCIYSGDCAILSGVQQLAAVINDVHFWGMMVHGQSCKADITAKIRSDPDADTGDITLLDPRVKTHSDPDADMGDITLLAESDIDVTFRFHILPSYPSHLPSFPPYPRKVKVKRSEVKALLILSHPTLPYPIPLIAMEIYQNSVQHPNKD